MIGKRKVSDMCKVAQKRRKSLQNGSKKPYDWRDWAILNPEMVEIVASKLLK